MLHLILLIFFESAGIGPLAAKTSSSSASCESDSSSNMDYCNKIIFHHQKNVFHEKSEKKIILPFPPPPQKKQQQSVDFFLRGGFWNIFDEFFSFCHKKNFDIKNLGLKESSGRSIGQISAFCGYKSNFQFCNIWRFLIFLRTFLFKI